MKIGWLILSIINFFIYFICCMLIKKRNGLTTISIRSPKLLILNNIGNFLMLTIIIITKCLNDDDEKGKKIVSMFYYLTNFLMIVTLCLRFQRIVNFFEVEINEKVDIQKINERRYLYEENYYLKLALIIFAILALVLIISDIPLKFDDVFTSNFLFLKSDKNLETTKSIIWLSVNFIEHLLLFTYVYKICIYQVKQKLRLEIILSFIIWFIYSNAIIVLEKSEKNYNNEIIYISIAFCYIFLILNSIIPIAISFSYLYSIGYHFSPNLMNNLFLFLSNEICYKEFYNYLNKINIQGIYYLKLYTQIINYKLGFKLKVDNEQSFSEALAIRNAYFNNDSINEKFPENILDKVKKECEGLENNNHFTQEVFDAALEFCYDKLNIIFNEFKQTDHFKKLYDEFYFNSYIYCKMYNIGLINKF